jgi:F-type H+-transporting ATPase subunit gamma
VRSTRDIRNKIRTVRNIEQICRAMKTVSSIRLRRAEQRLARARPYHLKLMELVSRLAAVTQAHPFLQPRPIASTGLVLVTSDRGLCGGYNAAVARAALAAAAPTEAVAIALGRKGLVHLRQHGYQVVDQLTAVGGEPDAAAVYPLADRAGRRYLEGEIDRLVLVYTQFLGGTRGQVRTEAVLPVLPLPAPPPPGAAPAPRPPLPADRLAEPAFPPDIIFEPAPAAMLPGLMRRYLRQALLGAVLEAAASEHAARVAAMTAATDNAEDMIERLTLDYNKARQAGITKELIEIVSAAAPAA